MTPEVEGSNIAVHWLDGCFIPRETGPMPPKGKAMFALRAIKRMVPSQSMNGSPGLRTSLSSGGSSSYNAQLAGADFGFCFLWGSKASIAGATVVLVNFANAYLTAPYFSGVKDKQCGGITFTGACLASANFTGTDLQSYDGKVVSLARAALQGANFAGATLSGADLTDAAVAQAPGHLTVTAQPAAGFAPFSPLAYNPTLALTAATSDTTICPQQRQRPLQRSEALRSQRSDELLAVGTHLRYLWRRSER